MDPEKKSYKKLCINSCHCFHDIPNLYEIVNDLKNKIKNLSDKLDETNLKIKEMESIKIKLSPVSCISSDEDHVNDFHSIPTNRINSYENLS